MSSYTSDLDWDKIVSDFHERYHYINSYFCHDENGNLLSFNDGNYIFEFEDKRFKMACRIDSNWCYDFINEEVLFKAEYGYIVFSIEEDKHLLTYNDSVYDLKSIRKQVWESKNMNARADISFQDILEINPISVRTISTNHIYHISFSLADTSFNITINIPSLSGTYYTIRAMDGNMNDNKYYILGIIYGRGSLSSISIRNAFDSVLFLFAIQNSRISRLNNILSYVEVGFKFVPHERSLRALYGLTLFKYNYFGRLRKNEIDLNFCE